jgi:hypothetical protein
MVPAVQFLRQVETKKTIEGLPKTLSSRFSPPEKKSGLNPSGGDNNDGLKKIIAKTVPP